MLPCTGKRRGCPGAVRQRLGGGAGRAGRRNYTVLTLEMLARTYPEAELYMAMGSDMLLSFDSWHRWQEILRLARLVVTSPECGRCAGASRQGKADGPTGARILFAQVEALPMASSDLRAPCSRGSV